MQEIHTPNPAADARVSRRNFMAFAAAGTAATLPAVALAGASGKTSRLPQPLDRQFDECVAQLRAILRQMHPDVTELDHKYLPQNAGRDFIFSMSGHAPALCVWDGPGIYELADCSDLPSGIYHVARVWSDMDRCWGFYAAFMWEGHPVAPRESIDPRLIVRKLEGCAA